ncbi:MAG: LTA synthase family protein [Elusimicrobia bacterium]|nr:LTA synthase family protein [Elusimicrobiota bacterium]
MLDSARWRLPAAAGTVFLAGNILLRAVLYARFVEPAAVPDLLRALWTGLRMDLAALSWLLLPWIAVCAALPERLRATSWRRSLYHLAFLAGAGLFFFLLATEYFFFDEFNARFNTVAVDYLLYPREVFANIHESYPVAPVAAVCALLALALWALGRRFLDDGLRAPPSRAPRWRVPAAYLALALLLTQSASSASARWSRDRVLNEVSGNGLYSFVHAAWSRDLDYAAFYRSLPREDAYARMRRMLRMPGEAWDPDPSSLRRAVPARGARRRNLVIILVESFGSEFWGSLGASPGWTPRMDGWSARGTLFTRLYATGNRTVRGLEGVLASFPPLPGESIVKRRPSGRVATLARTLRGRGYETLFVYGGRGIFDGMRAFALSNGFGRFIEQKDFESPVFTTAWGVCDEDILDRTLAELRLLHGRRAPFFAAVLTVSNHKPYTYPKGRIAEDPDLQARPYAVKYTDYALGRFLDLASREPFFRDTVFAVVADHGARVYGREDIPIHSYEIPLLIVGPGAAPGRRVGVLGSSLDVGPTLLGLLGPGYESVFFGRDLLRIPPETAFAPMHHNRDVGMLRGGRLVVLGLNKTVEFYSLDQKTRLLQPAAGRGQEDEELARDAAALFQTADELFRSRRSITD